MPSDDFRHLSPLNLQRRPHSTSSWILALLLLVYQNKQRNKARHRSSCDAINQFSCQKQQQQALGPILCRSDSINRAVAHPPHRLNMKRRHLCLQQQPNRRIRRRGDSTRLNNPALISFPLEIWMCCIKKLVSRFFFTVPIQWLLVNTVVGLHKE
jgi:hypothetical protein